MAPPIELKNVAKYYASLAHQNDALGWLQAKIEPSVLLEFARQWRKGEYTLGLTLANVCVYYEAQPHQVESLTWLQGQIDPDILIKFADMWRSGPPPIKKSNYYGQMTHGGSRQPQSGEHKTNIARMVGELEALEKHLGVPLVLTSGYRPEPINSEVGGVPGSQHTLGKAADFYSPDMDDFELEDKVIRYWYDGGKGGVGRGMSYRGFVHVDIGPVRIWDY